jgi:hypothetical protein
MKCDPREEIIQSNLEKIAQMHGDFKNEVSIIRGDLRDLADRSRRRREEMLNQILRLKRQIASFHEREEFLKRLDRENSLQRRKPKHKGVRSDRPKEVISGG